MKIALMIILALLVTGCSLQTKVASSTQYRLDITPNDRNFTSLTCKDDILQLKNISNYDVIQSRSIYYKVGDYKLFAYTQSNWEEAPSKTIQNELISALRDTAIFKDVITNRSVAKSNYILEYDVEDFVQHYKEDLNSSYVSAKVHFSIIENNSSKLLYSTTIQKELPTDSNDAFGGVKALRAVLKDLLGQTSLWLDERCQKGI